MTRAELPRGAAGPSTPVRRAILGWSALSGAVLGLLAGGGLLAAGVVVAALLPRAWGERLQGVHGLVPAALGVTLVLLPLAGAVLGWLEGRLKLR